MRESQCAGEPNQLESRPHGEVSVALCARVQVYLLRYGS